MKSSWILVVVYVMACTLSLDAQIEPNVKLLIETGFLPVSEGNENLGVLFRVESKVKVVEDGFFGLRLGVTLNSHVFESSDLSEFIIDNESDHGLLELVPMFDYYLNGKNYRPYLGLGVGYYLRPYDVDVFGVGATDPVIAGKVNNRIGGLLRGGFESSKWRFGVEYNFVPETDIRSAGGQLLGTVKSSYLGLSIGMLIIGGRDKLE